MVKPKTFQEDAMDILEGNMDIETLAKVDAGCGDKLTHGLKRGKDIKVFPDLPPDVQLAIDLLDIDPKEHARRVAEAINIYSQTDFIQQE